MEEIKLEILEVIKSISNGSIPADDALNKLLDLKTKQFSEELRGKDMEFERVNSQLSNCNDNLSMVKNDRP